jgi:WD40 repeat protein
LASGDLDLIIKIWNVTTGLLVNSLHGHFDQVSSLINLNSRYLACGSNDGAIIVWDYQNGALVKSYTNHSDTVNCLVFLNNRNLLLSTSSDRTLKVWNLTNVWSKNKSIKFQVQYCK